MNRNLRVQVDDIQQLSSAGSSSPTRSPGSRPSSRRGGFGDTGTLGTNGELPFAAEVFVDSERQLSEEFKVITGALDPKFDWEKRVKSLLRLEGLVKGGAATQFASFADHACALHAAMTSQLQDRRSAVSRQACHVISLIVQTCGSRVEALAVSLQPALLKAPAMSINIVTEAAEACLTAIIRCCPSPRLLPPICSTLRNDKNVKLRQPSAEYLLQALQEWVPMEYERHTEAVQAAILAANQDPAVEIRELGRSMFVAYYQNCPAEAQTILARLPDTERSLKDKLISAVNSSCSQGDVGCDATVTVITRAAHKSLPSRKLSDRSPSPVAPPTHMKRGAVRVPKISVPSPRPVRELEPSGFLSARAPLTSPSTRLSPRPASASARSSPAPARTRSAMPSLPPQQTEQTVPLRTVSRPGGARRSLGGAALRVAAAAMECEGALEADREISGVSRYASLPSPPRRIAVTREKAPALDSPSSPTYTPLPDVLARLSKPAVLWSTKVALYDGIQATLEQNLSRDLAENIDLVAKLVSVLMDGVGDAHFKVATAALHATVAALRSPDLRPGMEPYMENLVPCLFTRVADAKMQIRHLVGTALDVLHQEYDPESVMQGLAAAMHTARSPKVLCAIMEFYAEMASTSGSGRRNPAFSSGGRSVLASCMALATNKNPDVRQSAVGGIAVVYSSASPHLVESLLVALPASPQQAVARALSQALGSPTRAMSRELSKSPQPATRHRYGASPSPSPSTKPSKELLRSDVFSPALSPMSDADAEPSMHLGGRGSMPVWDSSPIIHIDKGESVREVDTPEQRSPSRSPSTTTTTTTTGWVERPHQHQLKAVKTRSPAAAAPVTISVDATFMAQCSINTPPPTPPSAGPVAPKLPALLKELRAEPSLEAMHRAADLGPKLKPAKRQDLASAVCAGLLQVMESDRANARLQEASMEAFSKLVDALSLDAATSWAGKLLEVLLRAASHEREEVVLAAERASKMLLETIDSVEALSLIIPFLPPAHARPPFEGDKAKQAAAALRCLHTAAGRVTEEQLTVVLDMVMPALCTCYTSPNAAIRKRTVDCVVLFHNVVGVGAMGPHLESLSVAQQKLIAIYVDKARGAFP